MEMIEEDYCSFEIAKLLKEKGFDEDCWCWYEGDGYFRESNDDYGFQSNSCHIGYDFICSAPTLQMAMKWLREVHHLYIDVGFGNDYKGEFLYMGDIYDLTKDTIYGEYKPIIEADDYLSDNPKTYEEACETAIKYCLENLI
jgi:hypothetical protein